MSARAEVCSEHPRIFGVDGWVGERPRGWTCCCGMNGPEGVRLAAPHETVAECHEAGRIDRERWAARAKERHEAHERAEAEAKQKPEAEAEEKSKQEGSSQQPEPEKKWPINAVTAGMP